MVSRCWAAAAGAVAAAAAAVSGELAAALLSPAVSPLTGVGSAVIDLLPPGVKDWAVSLFGTADKLAAVPLRLARAGRQPHPAGQGHRRRRPCADR
jgi:hypothetical protein